MPIIKWDDSLSVQIKEIDEQHKKLVIMINELYDAMKTGKGKDAMGKILSDLIVYTQTHFAFEEKYFDKFRYVESVQHKIEHKNLVMKAAALENEFKAGKATISMDVLNFLQEWLTKHIKGTDKKYTECFKKNGLI